LRSEQSSQPLLQNGCSSANSPLQGSRATLVSRSINACPSWYAAQHDVFHHADTHVYVLAERSIQP
jgi:hypothetical protein